MENEAESSSTSALAWRWTIEALASFMEVKPSLLHDVIDKALELLEDVRKNVGEMVALKCLQGLFLPLNDSRENGPPAQESRVVFPSSESCEHVVKRVCKELKDSILNGTRAYADFLMLNSGMMPVKMPDSISQNNDDLNECSRRHDSSSSDPQDQKEKRKDERRLSVADPSSPSLLPSKRSSANLTSEDEAKKLPGCDDGYVNVKRLKQHSAHTLYSGKEVASSHGTWVLEDSPVPQSERDDMDTDHLDEHQMNSVEDKVVERCILGQGSLDRLNQVLVVMLYRIMHKMVRCMKLLVWRKQKMEVNCLLNQEHLIVHLPKETVSYFYWRS